MSSITAILGDPVLMNRIIIWVGAIGTLAVYSFLYRENVVYRLVEHFYLGLAVGYGMFLVVTQILLPKWWVPMWDKGMWWWAFALVVGSMFYFIYSKKHNWISRLVFGAIMGLTAGSLFQDFAGTNFPKIAASLKALIPHAAYELPLTAQKALGTATPYRELTWAGAINNLIFIFVLVTVMSYFFFSFDYAKHRKMSQFAQVGRWMLMFALGAMFGATVMARMSLLIGRLWFLLHDWLRIAQM